MKRRPQSAALYKIGNPAKSEPSIPEARSRDSISRLMFTNKPQKTVSPPNQYFADQETLYFQNIHLQQEANEVRYQNVKLKTTIAQLQKRIQQIEKVDKYQTNVDPLGMSGNTEGSIIPMLKSKIREQGETINTLEEDLKQQCKSVKLTQLVELQKEIRNQQDEILRLRQQQQVALKITDQEYLINQYSLFQEPNINERIRNYVMVINGLENEVEVLVKQNDQLKLEYQELVDDNIKTKEEIKQISFEKTQLKKKLEDQVITETEQYQAKKREFLEKKLQSILKQVDSLKGELSLYENKYKLAVKQLKDQEREYKQTIVQTQKARQNLEEILVKKEQLIQDLQERVAIQDLLKQKSATPVVETPEVKQIIPPKTYRNECTQFPEVQPAEHKATDIVNTTPLDKSELQSLLEDLRYKMIQMGLTKQRLAYIFRGTQFIQLKDGIKLFMRQPFNYSEHLAIMLCRYFIGEDQGQSYRVQWEDTQSIEDLITLMIPSNEKFSFKSIVNRNTLIRQINSQMRFIKLENKIYNVDDYIIQLKRNSKLTDEQISLMRMINQQYLGDSQNIDQTFLQIYVKEEYEMLGQLSKLQKTDFTIFRQIPKLQVKLSYDYEDYPKLQIKTKSATEETYLPSKEIEPVLTLSQIRSKDQILKSSENRKPSSKDTLLYSNSCVESVPIAIKKQEEFKQSQGPFPNLTESVPQQLYQNQENDFAMGDSLMKPPPLLRNQQEEDEQIQEENEFNSENEVQMCEEL